MIIANKEKRILFISQPYKGSCIRSIIINSHILSHRVDWLHFGFATMGIGRELVGKAIGSKVAVSFRGYDIGIYPLKHENIYQRLWLNIDKVHTISDDLLEKAIGFGLPINVKVEKITPAIQVEKFGKYSNSSDIVEEPIRILTVGRMHWKKGGELMLQALEAIKSAGVNFRFTWIGNGPDLERLVFAVHQNNLSENVFFIGKQAHDAIPRIMRENDIYLQYSIQEGFCNAVLEAQAAGKLVIVSDAEGLSENVRNLETGWVVPKLDSAALTKAIMKVIGMKSEEREYIQNAARERVYRHFHINQQQQAFLRFYAD